MPPIHDDVTLHREDDFARDYVWEDSNGNPVDLTGWTGKSEIRPHAGDEELLGTFTVTFPNRLAGEFRISMVAADVDALTASRAEFDVVLSHAGTNAQRKMVKGAVFVEGTVTELP